MAKNAGKIFEDNFRDSINTNKVYYYRLRDSAAGFSAHGVNNADFKSRFTPKNDFDCFLVYDFNSFMFELKSTKQSSISFSRSKEDKKSIKYSQIEGLSKTTPIVSAHGGFIFNFRENDKRDNNTYYMAIEDFLDFFHNTDKQSINEKDIIEYNGKKIFSIKKKVNYKYDIEDLLERIKIKVSVVQ